MTADIAFFWVVFWCYLGASILYVLGLALPRLRAARLGLWLMVVGFLAQTGALIARTAITGHTPISSMFEFANCLAWSVVLAHLIVSWKIRSDVLGAIVALVAFGVVVIASLLPKDPQTQLIPALQSYWLEIHVSMAILAEGAFAVAFAAGLLFLLKEKRAESAGFFARVPALDTLDRVSFRAVAVGYPLFTAGALLAGAVWAYEAWGAFWSWDPKEVGALIVWFIYTAYLHARLTHGWRGRRAAILAVVGFAVAVLSFLGNLFLPGLHSYV
jgi:cytochrome c-type biogenesis protein CcsB